MSDEERLLLAIQNPSITAAGSNFAGNDFVNNYATIEFKSGPNLGGQYRLACYGANPDVAPASCGELSDLTPEAVLGPKDLPRLYASVANNLTGLFSETVDCYVWADGITGNVEKCQHADRVSAPWGAYIANNGVTVKCPGIDLTSPNVNPEFVLNGTTYTKRIRDGADGLFATRATDGGIGLATTCTTGIEDMSGVMSGLFDIDISSWDTSDALTMFQMFAGNSVFNRDISQWNTSRVENMEVMFVAAAAFNQDISGWDVSSVTDMSGMFLVANAFNQDIGDWDTSKVQDFSEMFIATSAFNGNISAWNTSSATNMRNMFTSAAVFNQDLSGWDTSKVENMVAMFADSDAFNQDLSSWVINPIIQGTSECGDFSTQAPQWVLPKPNLPADCLTVSC